MDGRKMESMEANDVEIIDVDCGPNEVYMAGLGEEQMQDDTAMRNPQQNEQAGWSKARGGQVGGRQAGGGQVGGHQAGGQGGRGQHRPNGPPPARQMSLNRSGLETASRNLMEESRGHVNEAVELEMFLAHLATAHVIQVCPTTMALEDNFGILLENDNEKKK